MYEKAIDILKSAIPDGVEICRKPLDLLLFEATCNVEIRGKPVRLSVLSNRTSSHYRHATPAPEHEVNEEGDQEAELTKAFSEALNI